MPRETARECLCGFDGSGPPFQQKFRHRLPRSQSLDCRDPLASWLVGFTYSPFTPIVKTSLETMLYYWIYFSGKGLLEFYHWTLGALNHMLQPVIQPIACLHVSSFSSYSSHASYSCYSSPPSLTCRHHDPSPSPRWLRCPVSIRPQPAGSVAGRQPTWKQICWRLEP